VKEPVKKGGGKYLKNGGGKYPKKPERKPRFKRGEARKKTTLQARGSEKENHASSEGKRKRNQTPERTPERATRGPEGPTTRGPPPEGTKADPIGPPAGAILGGNLRGTQGGKRDPLARI